MDANKVLSETETVTEQISEHIRDCAKLLHEREGEFITADEAITLFSNECEIEKELAAKTLTKLVEDAVDPVIQVNNNKGKLVGVVNFHEYDGAYGYTNFHDQFGQGKRVVCQQCVNESVTDADVTHATEGYVNGSFKNGASWDELVNAIHQHYDTSHSVDPTSVNTSVKETGATLVSGTTIGGGTAIHEGFTNPAAINIKGTVSDSAGNTMLGSVVATGQVSLSENQADVQTGITAVDATFMLAIGVDDPDADAEVAGALYWDDSLGEYEVRIRETETSVNPTVNFDIIRVR